MNLSSVEVEAWDDVGGYLASAPTEAHMFAGAWFPRLAHPRNMNVSFLQYLLWQVVPCSVTQQKVIPYEVIS